ncbi:MAG: hypothetical protein ED556_11225 [Winogradskyella sp.]|uniref:hypothetical protein n=1 Tax=Winogradskyella sp. TaxID=1883156 RepID=UPI000F3B2491|nr:hypothetical protein [Winogradskyella sp.]RNC85163.1 MAG: hypothetical protein ED556_11225 [Winogradskyella sp.]
MKSLSPFLLLLFLIVSCKSDKKETTKPLSTAEKIAQAHGFENWENIEHVEFSFRVDRDTIKGNARSWTWLTKKDSVVMQAGDQIVKYSLADKSNIPTNIDRAFINDKYWLLVPFQLIWDSSATISEAKVAEAPISKTQMDMITITYPSEGGYTPGDAYDIYFDKGYMIREWTFRKGNSEDPTLSTTFENYNDFNGIKIAEDHKQEDGSWNLVLDDIKVN